MGLISGLRNVFTGRSKPDVTGGMSAAEIGRLDVLLNEVPTAEEWRSLEAAGIHKINGIYRGPRYVLEAVGGTRAYGLAYETMHSSASGETTALIARGQGPTQAIDPRSIDGGEIIARTLSAIHARSTLKRIGGARR